MDDAFVRIFEFLQTEKLTTVHFFHHMDKDRNGKVDAEEFEGGLQEMGLQLTRVERKLCGAHALSAPPDYMPGLLPCPDLWSVVILSIFTPVYDEIETRL